MTIKNDKWIKEQAAAGMITPFEPELVREIAGHRVLSYGCSSYGYDLRLSANDFRVFRRVPGTVMDPKNFDPVNLEPAPRRGQLHSVGGDGFFFILPAHSYGLGVAMERLVMPPNVTGICLGKSTYARLGIIANMTPAEAGWEGHLTLEFSNSSGADCRIYANEGVVQMLFFEGEPCNTTYRCRDGKYQDQVESVTMAMV